MSLHLSMPERSVPPWSMVVPLMGSNTPAAGWFFHIFWLLATAAQILFCKSGW
jgi:hypothetical protein